MTRTIMMAALLETLGALSVLASIARAMQADPRTATAQDHCAPGRSGGKPSGSRADS
jgi:hypothetical protein